MKLVHFILSIPVLFFTISFAVSNRQEFPLTLWPFPFEIVLPISFIVLFFALLFFVGGGFYSWLLGMPVRSERNHLTKKVKELTKKVAELEELAEKNKEEPST